MVTIQIILGIILVYFVVVFLLPRFFIPFMGFKQYRLPKDLPDEVSVKIIELEDISKNQLEYLKNAYDFTQSRWQANRLKTILCLHLAFRKNLQKIWKMPGYAHCNTINFILYTLLAKSRFFTEQDIKIKHVFFNAVPY